MFRTENLVIILHAAVITLRNLFYIFRGFFFFLKLTHHMKTSADPFHLARVSILREGRRSYVLSLCFSAKIFVVN